LRVCHAGRRAAQGLEVRPSHPLGRLGVRMAAGAHIGWALAGTGGRGDGRCVWASHLLGWEGRMGAGCCRCAHRVRAMLDDGRRKRAGWDCRGDFKLLRMRTLGVCGGGRQAAHALGRCSHWGRANRHSRVSRVYTSCACGALGLGPWHPLGRGAMGVAVSGGATPVGIGRWARGTRMQLDKKK